MILKIDTNNFTLCPEKIALLFKVAHETNNFWWEIKICKQFAAIHNLTYTQAHNKLIEIYNNIEGVEK